MKFLAKLITNERILSLVNSNRFRGVIIIAVTWLVNKIAPNLFGEELIGGLADELIQFIGGVVFLAGQIEAQDRRYSEKSKSWKLPA